MAEDQEKQKPKTALIKHRKGETGDQADDADRKKVRVVVRRKPAAPKPTARPSEEREAPSGRSSVVRRGDSIPPSVREQAKLKKSSQQTPASDANREAQPVSVETSATPAATGTRKPASRTTAERAAATAQAGPEPEATHAAETPGGAGQGRPEARQPESQGPRNRFKVSNYHEQPPSVRESVRLGRDPVAPRDGARSPAGPPRPGRPGPFRPTPGRPGAPRPGGPPRSFRSTRPSPGAAPATTEDKKPGGARKFFKSKKKEAYPRRDRHQEKEIQLKKKSTVMANPVPKQIDIMEVITVSELARKMNLKASDLIGRLMGMGMMVTINQQIDAETASLLADEYGCKVRIVSLYDETIIETAEDTAADLLPRPPVVTVMGHVDHGKTKLLDAIRSTNVVDVEFGGITQHIGAYQVKVRNEQPITFLDTPGHEAFGMMRARGAKVTDLVVLVVAADDGVMPQTREAIDHARAAKVPILVAVNKVDLPDANPDRVKQQLSDLNLMPEEWGGNTLFAEVSALKRQGIDELLESILLQAEILELRANHASAAEGTVIESRIDAGRGTVSTVLIQRGTLKVGDNFVAGVYPGRVRSMYNDRGERVESAGPAMPVEIVGFTGIPEAGDPFQVTGTEKLARQVGDKRQELKKVEEARNVKKITLDNLYDSIQQGTIDELRVIIKGDVHGSVEALQAALERLSTKTIRLSVLRAAAGAINEDDVRLAVASDAIIIGFHVRPTSGAQQLADREKVEIRKYNIIYDVVNDIRAAMEGMLAPEYRENAIGRLEVRETFRVPKIGVIAGCYVTEGTIRRNAGVHLVRDGVQVYTGKISSLKRFKDDAREVDAGYECGVGIENFNDIKVGDTIEAFEMEQIAKTLEDSDA